MFISYNILITKKNKCTFQLEQIDNATLSQVNKVNINNTEAIYHAVTPKIMS